MKNAFLYLLGLFAAIYLSVMYDAPYLYDIFWIGLILFVLCAVQVLFLASRVDVSINITKKVVETGEEVPIALTVTNRTSFPLYQPKVKISYQGWSRGAEERKWLKAGNDQLSISSHYCGIMRIRAKRIVVTDILHIFRRHKRLSEEVEVAILPELHLIPLIVGPAVRSFHSESEAYSTDRSGDDPSEVFDVREFRPGDRMQRIHWKMSAKSEGYIVKEFSQPEGYPVIVFLNAYQEKANRSQFFRLHRMIQTAASISQSLILEECGHYLAWYDEAGTIERCPVKEEAELYTALLKIIRIQPHDDRTSCRERYEMMYGEASYLRFLSIDMAGEFWCDDEIVCQLNDEETETGLPIAELVI